MKADDKLDVEGQLKLSVIQSILVTFGFACLNSPKQNGSLYPHIEAQMEAQGIKVLEKVCLSYKDVLIKECGVQGAFLENLLIRKRKEAQEKVSTSVLPITEI